MKAISTSIALGILLVSLLGFLGCSDSDAGSAAVPGEANPIAPFGIIDTMDPKFIWTPVPGVTEYRLMVQDASDVVIIDGLYTVEESGCASEEVSCTVHPEIITVGEHSWKVKACAHQECGQWSELLKYDMRPDSVSYHLDRFTDWGDGTVTDNNSQLTWTVASVSKYLRWKDAIQFCEDLECGGYDTWDLPTLNEIYSLREIAKCFLTLNACHTPYAHPMTGGFKVWSASVNTSMPRSAWSLSYGVCFYELTSKTDECNTYCVLRQQFPLSAKTPNISVS